jgi:uncharacterized RDD family membrane protein YckC
MSAVRGAEGAGATVSLRGPAPHLRAGVVTRVIAACVDGLVVAVLVFAVWVGWCALAFLWQPRAFSPPSPPPAIAGLGYSLTAVAYLTSAWALSGRTSGYQLMGLRAVDRTGGRLGWARSAGRAAMCVIFPIGLLWTVVSPGRRALHDIVWRTYVCYDWTPHQASVNGLAGQLGEEQGEKGAAYPMTSSRSELPTASRLVDGAPQTKDAPPG